MALTKEEQLEAIERYYRGQVAGTTSDEEELAVAEALLEAAERGTVVLDDGTTMVLRDMGVPSDADFLVNAGDLRRQELRRTLPVLGVLAIALIAAFLLYGGSGTPSEETTPTAAAAAQVALSTATLTPTITPTPSPTSTGTPTPIPTATLTPTPLAPEEVEVKIEPVELDPNAVIPVSIEIAGRYFPVLPTGLREDVWAYATDPDQASWLAGSYVNVVLGLPYTEANADLLGGTLALSDTVTVRNSVAAVNHYTVVSRGTAGIYEIEAFSQRQAGLTLVLLGGSEEAPDRRLIVHAALAGGEGEEVVGTEGE